MTASHGFTDVDAQSDPDRWVRILDVLSDHPFYRRYKQRVRELLAVRAGGLYLDVGAGTGADAQTTETTTSARLVVLDSSSTMVAEARRRGSRRAIVGDAHALPFSTGLFDGASADRVFQHLANPQQALDEAIRVLKPGGRIVLADPDYQTQRVTGVDQDLADTVRRWRLERSLRNGRFAAEAADHLLARGLQVEAVDLHELVITDRYAIDNVMGLWTWGRAAHEAGMMTEAEADVWPRTLDDAVAAGTFEYRVEFVLTAASLPGQ